MKDNKNFKSGFVAVIGRPNVGKSTLINNLIGEKISITSDKAQTTRNKIMCVLTRDDFQVVFLDTPGIHKPKHRLGKFMINVAESALKEVNVVVFIVDATEKKGTGDEFIMKKLLESKKEVLLVINKIDKIDNKEDLLPIIQEYTDFMPFSAVIPISALKDSNFDSLIFEIKKHLLDGPKYFPDDMVTDQPERILAAELIREKVLRLTYEEVPHAVAVDVEEMKTRPNGDVYIRAAIYVERESQKGIVIGSKGALLKKVGKEAREDIESLLGSKIFLDLWVKVKNDWRNKSSLLKDLGFE